MESLKIGWEAMGEWDGSTSLYSGKERREMRCVEAKKAFRTAREHTATCVDAAAAAAKGAECDHPTRLVREK